MTDIQIESTNILASENFRRREPRPHNLKQEDYDEKFDYHSLFYDIAFYKNKLMFIGPIMNGEENLFRLANITVNGVSVNVQPEFVHEWKVTRTLYYLSDEFMRMVRGNDSVVITFSLGEISATFHVKANVSKQLQNANTIVTMNKDNKLIWISDWLKWNVSVNGFDTAIIFDNGSETYSVTDFNDPMFQIEGLKKLVVVSYPVKYGPLALIQNNQKLSGYDSDFGQYVAISIARYKYSEYSSTFSFCDIDEYIYPLTDTKLVDAVKETIGGYISVTGYIVDNIFKDTAPKLFETRAKDYHYISNRAYNANNGMKKYIIDLDKIPENLQAWVHGLDSFRKGYEIYEIPENELGLGVGEKPDKIEPDVRFGGGHFKGLSLNWRNNNRDRTYIFDASKPNDRPIPDEMKKFMNEIF